MATVYSVSQINRYIKNMFAQDYALRSVKIRGEVSNCKYHTSDHIYFTIKDQGGTLSAVMFKSQRKGLSFRMQDGQQVVVTGSIEVYEKNGSYQLYATTIEMDGVGDLYEKYLKLKKELEEMGMFSEEYKKPIPKYVSTIGIVTAKTGAVIHDIENVARRRNPYIKLIHYPSKVQGEGTAHEVAEGIATLDKMGLDVIIVARGGGSIEDLWGFNEEEVARAIWDANTPIISAVGHETDFTIADYVADLRAPTPSAAAELATVDMEEFMASLKAYRDEMTQALHRRLNDIKRQTENYKLKVDMNSPMSRIRTYKTRTEELRQMSKRSLENKLISVRHRMALYAENLKGLSPLGRLASGYAYVTDDQNKKVKSTKGIHQGDEINLYYTDGSIKSKVLEVKHEKRK